MAFLMPNQGEIEALKRLVNVASMDTLKLKLFSNDYAPVSISSIGSFTECTIAGYAGATLTPASWSFSTGATTEKGEAAFPQVVFALTTGGTIYGYYITNMADTVVLCAERFADAPNVFPSGGGEERVTPKIIATTA